MLVLQFLTVSLDQGSRVWLTDKEEVWKGGVVLSYVPGDNIVVADPETGKVRTFSTFIFDL